jgi:putative transposase
VASFVDWYNHQHRLSGIIFVTPQQRHDGQAVEISRQRCRIRKNPPAQSEALVTINQVLASTGVVWINQPPDELNEPGPLPLVQAA